MAESTVVYTPESNSGSVPAWMLANNGGLFGNGNGWGGGILGFLLGLFFGNGWGGFGGKQFQNTVVHEVHHLAVAIAKSLGVDLDGEDPAYLSGDSAMEIADIICTLGCRCCNRK